MTEEIVAVKDVRQAGCDSTQAIRVANLRIVITDTNEAIRMFEKAVYVEWTFLNNMAGEWSSDWYSFIQEFCSCI